MNPPAVRCSEQVRSNGMGFHWHQCHSAGKVMREGKMFCGTHDPVAVQARHDKRIAKWDAERDADHVRYEESARLRARAALCVVACEGLTDGDLKRLTELNRCDIMAFIAKQI